jgi:hypothetical protein
MLYLDRGDKRKVYKGKQIIPHMEDSYAGPWPETRKALKYLETLRESNASPQKITSALRILGKTALEEKDIYKAVRAFKELDDKKGLKKAGDEGLKNEWFYDAFQAFKEINDESGLRQIVVEASKRNLPQNLEDNFLFTGFGKRIYEDFRRFYRNYGFERASGTFDVVRMFNSANELAKNYDLGIGLAKGGLFGAYAFREMGLPAIIAEPHRKGKGATFKWHDAPKGIEGKKVIVFDKDAVTGRTLKRSLNEINKYSPEYVDLFFSHDPVGSKSGHAYAHLDAVPEGFRKIFTPISFNYHNFTEVYDKLYAKFGRK